MRNARADVIGLARRYRTLRAPPGFLAKSKVAVRGAFHERLRSCEFDVRIEAGDHRMISVKMDKVTDIREPEILIEFGVSATRDIETEAIVRLANRIDIKAASAGPDIFGNSSQRSQVAAVGLSPFGTIISGESTNGRYYEFVGAGLAKPLAARFDEWYENAPLNFTALQMTDMQVLLVFHSGLTSCGAGNLVAVGALRRSPTSRFGRFQSRAYPPSRISIP